MSRVLFVDDDPYTLETLTKAVQILGHEAILANSGEEALQLAVQQTPHLIFIDLLLPDMDGLDLLAALKDLPETAGIPTLILSASPEVGAAERAMAAGAQAFIGKPIRLQSLMELIKQYSPDATDRL